MLSVICLLSATVLAFVLLYPRSARAASPDAKILSLCEEAKDNVIAFTEKMVNMDSGSDDYPELHAKQAELMKMLENLGGDVLAVEAAPPRQGTYNIVATWRGTGKARIMYMNHYDTVWGKGEAAKRPFTIKDRIATGPGVSDSQCNFGAVQSMLDILLNKLDCRDFACLTVMFNCDEEKMSLGSKDLIMDLASQHDVVYSLDGGGLNGDKVTLSARGGAQCELFITGVESHSGSAPDKGRNAGYEMAHQMLRMRDLGDKSKGTDVNWTMGKFGTKSNVIPGTAWTHANIRISQIDEWERIKTAIEGRIKETLFPECTIKMNFIYGRPPFTKNATTDMLVDKAATILGELGRPLQGIASGGGTDSNYSSQKAPALEGLGIGGSGAHSLDERLPLDNIVPRLYLLVRLSLDTMQGKVLPIGVAKPV